MDDVKMEMEVLLPLINGNKLLKLSSHQESVRIDI